MGDWRIIVVGVLYNQFGNILLCKKPVDRGVFAGKWGLPGGGIETGEKMIDALRREMWEEVGLELDEIKPALFKDGEHTKILTDGEKRNIYMIFLIFACTVKSDIVKLNDEFEEYIWASKNELINYDLDEQTRHTFINMGLLK